MFGISEYDMPKDFGSIWYLGSDECTKHPFTFVREGLKFTQQWLRKYKILINAVDNKTKRFTPIVMSTSAYSGGYA